jgi:Tfp pilus assembly protein PilO
MEENNLRPETNEENKTEIFVNDYGATVDSTVVVEEADRTVLLTDDQTFVIPKETVIDLPPKNRERKVYAGMWGNTELITVGVALLSILTTVLLFVFLVLPARRELDNNRTARNDLADKFETARSRYGTTSTTQERVTELVTSVDNFEARLPNETIGKPALYQRINGLIAAYGLVNTAGPLYSPLEILDQNRSQQSEAEKGRSKFISVYPGVYVSMTLDGSYQNLRRFINEIERSEQFVIVSAVELEPSENKEKETINQQPINQAPVPANPAGINQAGINPGQNPNLYQRPGQIQNEFRATADKIDRGKTRGETVTLRLEMAAYFRRAGFAPQAVEPAAVR